MTCADDEICLQFSTTPAGEKMHSEGALVAGIASTAQAK